MAINQRAVDKGMARYPGDHDWRAAWAYFTAAAELVAGTPLVWLGIAGAVVALIKRWFWILAILALPSLFYVASLYSSGTPIYLPQLWPKSYYNTRYGLAAFPLLVAAAAAITAAAPRKLRPPVALLTMLAAVVPWWSQPVITWKESQVNSEARRAWTREAAEYLRQHYDGRPILTSFGDLTGIFEQAGIPLVNTIHDGNSIYWLAPVYKPELFLNQEWAVTFAGDAVASAILKLQRKGVKYDCVKMVMVKGAPVIEIYRRGSQVRLPQEEPEQPRERTDFTDQ
jgi:hypothetical protein